MTTTETTDTAPWVEALVPPEVQAEGQRILGQITEAAPKIAEAARVLAWLFEKDRELYDAAEAQAITAGGSDEISNGLGELVASLTGLSTVYTVLYGAGIDPDEFAGCYHPAEGDQ